MTSGAHDSQAARTRAGTALQKLAVAHSDLADVLAKVLAVVAEEALRNGDFATRLNAALVVDRSSPVAATPPADKVSPVGPLIGGAPPKPRAKRGRRAPGPWDPFDVYAEVGEAGLRDRLSALGLEQLRDIVAEHGFNNDGLAMRWTKADRVAGRIVDRVVEKAVKGDAFRRA